VVCDSGACRPGLLFFLGGALAAGLVRCVLWYNGIYTYVKRVSSLAPVAGSVIGAIPPAIGWVCAGGGLGGPILALSFFLLMWQVRILLLACE